MQLIDQNSAEAYLRESGRLQPHERASVRELTGGVSNMVLLVELPDQPDNSFVLKQARAQLRTQLPWFSNIERIWREADVLRICQQLLSNPGVGKGPAISFGTPRILFEDRGEYLFGMTAAARPNVVWKRELLAGKADLQIAAAAGALLGTLHAGAWEVSEIADKLGDRTLFDQLRVEPYYRTLAARRPDAREGVERLIASLADHRCSLVHADYSPKNLLVSAAGLTLVDFETGHYGDPAFDLGFFLSHLLLKACLHAPRHDQYLALMDKFCASYDETLATRLSRSKLAKVWPRGLQNLAGCAWARLDGKSPVEYLTDEDRREAIRWLCREIFERQPHDLQPVLQLARERFEKLGAE